MLDDDRDVLYELVRLCNAVMGKEYSWNEHNVLNFDTVVAEAEALRARVKQLEDALRAHYPACAHSFDFRKLYVESSSNTSERPE